MGTSLDSFIAFLNETTVSADECSYIEEEIKIELKLFLQIVALIFNDRTASKLGLAIEMSDNKAVEVSHFIDNFLESFRNNTYLLDQGSVQELELQLYVNELIHQAAELMGKYYLHEKLVITLSSNN